ncbi:hypothetical protein ACLKA7_016031 [Drosophila subpalustris]
MDLNTLVNTLKELCNTNNISWNPYYLDDAEGKEVGNLACPICTFYVNSYDQAKKLNSLKVPADIWLQLKVTNNRVPQVRLDPSLRERLRLAILKQYRPIRESLDLFCFHKDDQWKEEFFSLAQKSCMSAAIDVMQKYMPKLRSLILDNNCLTDLSAFQGIEHRLPQLTYISLIFNDLENVNTLKVFEHLSLTQLDIAHNPLDTPIKRQQLAKLLPKLILIDGMQMDTMNESTSQAEKADQTDQQIPGEKPQEQMPKQGLESSVNLDKIQNSEENTKSNTQEADHNKQQKKILGSNEKKQSTLQEVVQIKQQLPEPRKQIPKQVPKLILRSSVKLENILESNENNQSLTKKANQIKHQIPQSGEKIPKQVPKVAVKSNVKLEKILESNENSKSQTQEANQKKQRLPGPVKRIHKHVPKQVLTSSVKLKKIQENELNSKETEQMQPKSLGQVEDPIPKPVAEKKHSQTHEANHSEQQLPEPGEHVPKQVSKLVVRSSVKSDKISEAQKAENIERPGEKVPVELFKIPVSIETTQSKKREVDHMEQQLSGEKSREQIPKQAPEHVLRLKPTNQKQPRALELQQEDDPLISKPVEKKARLQTQELEPEKQIRRQVPEHELKSSYKLKRIDKLGQIEDGISKLSFQEAKARKNDLQRFLNEYLRIYDNDSDRSGLKWLYQETAVVKFTTSEDAFASCLDFLPDKLNTNFNRFKDGIQIKNHDSALAHFSSLPKTQHLLPTIIADLLELRHKRVRFAISGFFKYLNMTHEPFNFQYFMRSFVLTPLPDTAEGPDFRIASEVVYICEASRVQLLAGVIPHHQDQSHFMLKIMEPLLPDIVGLRRLEQDNAILQLSQQTQMKWEWCHKCLVDFRWDLEASLARVKEMQEQNLIPKAGFLPKPPKSGFEKIF